MEDLTGRQFGPYRVVAMLGRGGMASVYKAYQAAVDRYVALKVLSRQFNADPQFLSRFRHEARILAQLQHPRILQVYDFDESDGYAFLAMPFVNGGTLAAASKRGPVPLGVTARIVGQICDAIDYAHSKGIVHRDIKPSNILLDERQNCLVADFGLARIVEDASHLTIAGAVMGTPAYMSPEQASGAKVEPASDIYSVGIVLYELLTGRVPFVAETPAAVMMGHLTAPLPPPRTLNPALSAALEAVVLKALARAPEHRFASAREFHAVLAAAIRETPQTTSAGVIANDSSDHTASDDSAVFPTIASDAFLAKPAQTSNAVATTTHPRRMRVIGVTVAVLTALLAAAGGILLLLQQRAPDTGVHPAGFQQPPAVAADRPSAESPLAPARLDEQPAVSSSAREAVGIPTRPITVPAATRPPAVDHNVPPVSAPASGRDADDAATTQREFSHVVIDTLPRSQVYVDNVFRGEAAADGHLVVEIATAGAHTLRISLTGKRDFEQEVRTLAGQTLSLHPALTDATGNLQIRTSAGAEVLVDNSTRGVANADGVLSVQDVASGWHDVRVLLSGKKEFRQAESVDAGRESIVDAPLENLEPAPNRAKSSAIPAPSPGNQFLLFHFVDGNWHFGILTISTARFAWTETATAGYSLGHIGGFLNFQSIEPGLHMDDFVAACADVVDVGDNVAIAGEHVHLSSRNYNFAIAVKNKDGKLVPKANAPIPGLHKAAEDACPGVVK